MNLYLKDVKRALIILFIGGLAGLAMLMLVYMIPTGRMLNNARASIELFESEGPSPQDTVGYKATTLDNYTDSWMLRNAFYDGEESALQKSLNIYFYGYNGQYSNICESMIAYLNGVDGYSRNSYARYWHGYLVLLKPLLCFFDYTDIRGILKLMELSLLICLCRLFEQRKMGNFLPALAVLMFTIGFHEIGKSLQYSWVFLIAVTASIYILKKYPVIDVKMVFLLIGMCTSYFDFLTYPVFTLGMPLVILLSCRYQNENAGGGKNGCTGICLLGNRLSGVLV